MSLRSTKRMPEFIAVGPPRTATTWLDQVLVGHVGLSKGVKETHYFSWYYDLGPDWYQRHFRNCSPDLPIVEITTTYFDSSMARERIKRDIPQCRIICTLRDPVGRLFSNYRLLRRLGFIGHDSVEKAIDDCRKWEGQGNMLGLSRYTEHVRAWREQFGDDRVLVVLYDDLEENPQNYLDQVTSFVGIPRIDLADSPVAISKVNEMNQAPKSYKLARRARVFREWLRKRELCFMSERFSPLWNYCFGRGEFFPPLSQGMEASLRESFLPEVEALETLLHRDLTRWKQGR